MMNERIKELAEQAAQEVRVEHNNPYWRMQNEIKEDADWREKFAELIVRECASICDHQGRVGWYDDRKAQARLDRDLIKEHFGVE